MDTWIKRAAADTLYHGTSNEARGLQIVSDGHLRPSDVSVQRRGHLAPVKDRVYLAQDPAYAVIYTLGANMLGSTLPNRMIAEEGRFGYLFTVSAQEIRQGQPDEDDIGRIIWEGAEEIKRLGGMPNEPQKCPPWLTWMARQHLTQNQLAKVLEGDYAYWAAAGKKLVRLMTPDQKAHLISKYRARGRGGRRDTMEGGLEVRQGEEPRAEAGRLELLQLGREGGLSRSAGEASGVRKREGRGLGRGKTIKELYSVLASKSVRSALLLGSQAKRKG